MTALASPDALDALRKSLAMAASDPGNVVRADGTKVGYKGDRCMGGWIADAIIAGPLAPLLADLQRVTAERDEAREERDALRQAAGFKPGSFETALSREVILGDIAGMRPAMVEARRAAARVQGDADLWTMRMLEEWPGDTLLLRLWRQRKETTKAKRAAEAALANANAELARLRAEGEAKDRALKPFADYADFAERHEWPKDIAEDPTTPVLGRAGWDGEIACEVTVGDFQAARAATAGEG